MSNPFEPKLASIGKMLLAHLSRKVDGVSATTVKSLERAINEAIDDTLNIFRTKRLPTDNMFDVEMELAAGIFGQKLVIIAERLDDADYLEIFTACLSTSEYDEAMAERRVRTGIDSSDMVACNDFCTHSQASLLARLNCANQTRSGLEASIVVLGKCFRDITNADVNVLESAQRELLERRLDAERVAWLASIPEPWDVPGLPEPLRNLALYLIIKGGSASAEQISASKEIRDYPSNIAKIGRYPDFNAWIKKHFKVKGRVWTFKS